MRLIDTTQELAAVCERAAHFSYATVDTEFLRESTFWPKVCVIQFASPEEAVAVDALAEGLDLEPFFQLMRNPAVIKVFHAARQDIEAIWRLARFIPDPLFDTQIAAMVCGYGDQASYGDLAHQIVRVSLDKSSRFTDWSRRPLSPEQIAYAIADVTHLRDIYLFLKQKLEESGRIEWLKDDMAALLSPATYEQKPENAWERYRGRARKPRDLAVLMDLAAWREAEAQARDVPRSRILKDDMMVEIAYAAPKDASALANLRAFPRGMEKSKTGADILDAVARGLARNMKGLPRIDRERRPQKDAAAVELLKVLLRQVSEKHGVAPKLLATVDDLEAIAGDDDADVAALKGWRYEIFGAKALLLKRGRLALTVNRGKVSMLEWKEPEEAPTEEILEVEG